MYKNNVKDIAVFQKAVLKIIFNKNLNLEKLQNDLQINNKTIIDYLKKNHTAVNSKYYKKEEVEIFIDRATETLLGYARHEYNKGIDFTNDDNFDALVTSIIFLGQELNFSTVTTNYTEDVFNSIGDLLLVVDNFGYILFVNNATCKVLGYSKNEIERQQIKMILEKDIEFQDIINNKNKREIFKYRSKFNKSITVSLNVSDFSRRDNPFMGYVIIARDISLTLKYEKEIEEQNKRILRTNEKLKIALVKAKESERLKSAFLANMSHEIRTPLNGIMGFSEILQYENSKEDYKNYGKTILKCSNQLLGIVNNVLDISKIEAGLMEVSNDKCNINEIFNDLYEVYKQKIIAENKKIELSVRNNLIKSSGHIITDELRLKQIISNLLDNAIKFSETGSIDLECYLKKGFIEFSVKDTGIGISKEKTETIFKPFIQAAKSTTKLYGGTGLGLAIAKGLVNLLEGEISVASTLNKGSEFIFSIPYIEDTSGIKSEITDVFFENNEYNWKNETVLLIEDNNISATLIKKILKPTGVSMIHTKLGIEAIELFNNTNDISLIIVDYELPDIDGCEITRDIRKINKVIPIIAQTAYATKEDEKRFFMAGCNFFIPKPIKSKVLLASIAKCFENKK